MSAISFYRQARRDGGIRTGITIDADTVLHRYENGGNDSDPALVWFVDVRCEGRRLPTEPEPAREWFLSHAQLIKAALRASAEELRAGIDIGSWPLERSISGPRGVRMRIVCSAVRRLEALDIARILHDIADHWEERIKALQEADAIVH
jgi:hypothetical protein